MMEEVRLFIEDMSHDGRGIARIAQPGTVHPHPDVVCFVRNALPTQTVRATITARKRNYWEAETTELLDPGRTVQPVCPHSRICGGCPLQTLPYSDQLTHKTRILKAALTRIARLPEDHVRDHMQPVLPSPVTTCFRNKMEFAFGEDTEGRPVLGQRMAGRTTVVPTPGCVLMPTLSGEICAFVQERARESGLPAYTAPDTSRGRNSGRQSGKNSGQGFWRFCTLRLGADAGTALPAWFVICTTARGSRNERDRVKALGEDLLQAFPDVSQFIHEERHRQDSHPQGEYRVRTITRAPGAAPCMLQHLGGRPFLLDPASFFQVNSAAAEHIAGTVSTHLHDVQTSEEDSILDLYCGVGAPTLCGATSYSRLVGIDIQKESIRFAERNAQTTERPSCTYIASDIADAMDSYLNASVLVLDPPRAGVERSVLQKVTGRMRSVIYVSCNPASLARDLSFLTETYSVEQIQPIDLFPHTPHIETVVLLRRR